MTYVKAEFPANQTHVPMLMGLVFQHVRTVFDAEDWGGLRQSHFRVMSSVPVDGISITMVPTRAKIRMKIAATCGRRSRLIVIQGV